MPLVVKKDETFDPMNVSLLGSIAILPRADRLANLVEQLRVRSRWRRRSFSFKIQPSINHRQRVVYWSVRVDVIYHNDSPRPFAYGSAAALRERCPAVQ
jgi:hypothetical protein